LARSCEQDSRVVAGAKNRAGITARSLTTSADEKLGHEILPSSYVAAFVTGIVVRAAATRDLKRAPQP